jgi:uncharacterized protein
MDAMHDLETEAQDFIRQLDQGDFAAASRTFDGDLAQAFPEAKLKETWVQLIGQVGPFQKLLTCQTVEKQGSRIVTVSCQFEKTPIDFRMVYGQNGQMSGLTFQLAPSTLPYNPPAYAHIDAFHEVEVTVGSGEWALPATLSMPEGSGPFPALVLVHGSGPQDRDEAIGPNKPFRDLAWGLASQGIAVLSYEKRTKAHGAQFTPELISRLTVQEEVIDDALLAVQLLRQTPGIDKSSIYVLGHSLGATVAPRIGQQDPAIAGLIVMGGMTRAFEDTILDQFTYLYNLSGALTDTQKAELEELKLKVARVKDPNFPAHYAAKDLPLGITPAYWLDLRTYHPAEVAGTLAMRIFVMQGGRDYQVTAAGDFPAWQQALREKSSATLKLYPKLYHLFIAGEGPSTPQEYLVEGHVSAEVIEDIVRWIKAE